MRTRATVDRDERYPLPHEIERERQDAIIDSINDAALHAVYVEDARDEDGIAGLLCGIADAGGADLEEVSKLLQAIVIDVGRTVPSPTDREAVTAGQKLRERLLEVARTNVRAAIEARRREGE